MFVVVASCIIGSCSLPQAFACCCTQENDKKITVFIAILDIGKRGSNRRDVMNPKINNKIKKSIHIRRPPIRASRQARLVLKDVLKDFKKNNDLLAGEAL